MTPEKWQDTKVKIKEKFEILENYQEKDEERREDKEILIFNGPAGKIKLEFITRPVVLDKKTNYSRRIGSQVEVEYIYSEDEFTNTLKTYIFDAATNDWQELKAHNFEL